MKVFVSHQKADSALASAVVQRLKYQHSIESYLDVIDPDASRTGDALGDYLRTELGRCTHLLAVVSSSTQSSWWVPWEIGVATEKDFPIATYAGDSTPLPSYLKKWPYLRSQNDLDAFARSAKLADSTTRVRKGYITEAATFRRHATQEFYSLLRSQLSQ